MGILFSIYNNTLLDNSGKALSCPNTNGHLLLQMPGYGLLAVLMVAELSYFFVRDNAKCIYLVPPNIIPVPWLVS